MHGRLLLQVQAHHAASVGPLTERHAQAGLLVSGTNSLAAVREVRQAGAGQLVVAETVPWAGRVATAEQPTGWPDDGLFPMPVEAAVGSLLDAGADVALGPSGFVRAGDFRALAAVLRMGMSLQHLSCLPYVPTSMEMLDGGMFGTFSSTLSVLAPGRALALQFAGPRRGLATGDRLRNLRLLLPKHPGSLVLGLDAVVGFDVTTRGHAGAVGATGTLRQPQVPGRARAGFATGFIPGVFLRELWETRSPAHYADWYANRRTQPVCQACGPRSLDSFEAYEGALILQHNVHSWLGVLADFADRPPAVARRTLTEERLDAVMRHLELRGPVAVDEIDPLLYKACKLDVPDQLNRALRATSSGKRARGSANRRQ